MTPLKPLSHLWLLAVALKGTQDKATLGKALAL
jgi:hypothetical protein